MRETLNIPTYTSKDFHILVGSMLPMAVVLNYFLYGKTYFSEPGMFFTATIVTFLILGFAFLTYGFVAIFLRNRFPEESQMFKRLSICISIFALMSALYISLILISYDNFRFFGYQYSDSDFVKSFIAFVVINIFLTFLNEGVYRFEKYRTTATETAQLQKEYMQSQLLGLKSQMNPHFLFNSLNTLSSLIHEDADQAEDFLDHMSKVYRYLLRNNEEQLVTVETELSFIRSYYFLLKARHADGLDLTTDVSEVYYHRQIPPLTLQMIVENALNQNTVSRSTPLHIHIHTQGEWLSIKNNIQPRISNEENYIALENIANKFRLLCQQEIIIQEFDNERTIQLPLIPENEMSAA